MHIHRMLWVYDQVEVSCVNSCKFVLVLVHPILQRKVVIYRVIIISLNFLQFTNHKVNYFPQTGSDFTCNLMISGGVILRGRRVKGAEAATCWGETQGSSTSAHPVCLSSRVDR